MFLVVLTTTLCFADISVGETIALKDNNGKITYLINGKETNNIPELYTKESEPELYCLALNIYHESRSDNMAGQAAVADVVLNRVTDARYPNTICEVVKEGPIRESWKTRQDPNLSDSERKFNPVRNRCQFSWWCDGKSDEPRQPLAWRKAQEIAYHLVHNNLFRGISEGATHYHATYVDPHWNKSMIEIGRIGEHIFYRSLPK